MKIPKTQILNQMMTRYDCEGFLTWFIPDYLKIRDAKLRSYLGIEIKNIPGELITKENLDHVEESIEKGLLLRLSERIANPSLS
jgi:hypothetical protein|tara:strand:+ start:155 stop:406 length:252 start_codon:yes stop_codon:yes gene_type:complete